MNKKATIFFVFLIIVFGAGCFLIRQVFSASFVNNVYMRASAVSDRKITLSSGSITNLGWGGTNNSAVPVSLVNQNVNAVSGLTEDYVRGLFDNFKATVVDPFLSTITIIYQGSLYNLSQIQGLIDNHNTLISNLEADIGAWENTKGIYGRGSGSANKFAIWSNYKTLGYDSGFYVNSSNQIVINKNLYASGGLDISNGGDLNVSGSKSFKIEHPTEKGKKLVHATLEGPEAAVFYRGESQLINGKAVVKLPEYFEGLTRKEGRTVFLTPMADSTERSISSLAASSVENGMFEVRGLGDNPTQRFFWQVDALRADVWPLEVERKKVGGNYYED